MNLFIGNKLRFGIEIIIDSRNQEGYYLGYAKLWFGGNFLGTIEEYIYINSYLIKELTRMLNAPQFDENSMPDLNSKHLYFKDRNENINDNEIDSFRFNFGTMSDRFMIWAYQNLNDLVIVWKFQSESSEIAFSDLKDYSDRVFEYRLPYCEFSSYVHMAAKIFSIPDLLADSGEKFNNNV